MPQFEYQGVDRAGKRVRGALEAGSEGDLRVSLRAQGIRPTRITSARSNSGGKTSKGGSNASLNLSQLVGFCRQLQVLISSGIPIVQGLEILADQAQDKGAKQIYTQLKERVSQGSYFWEALSMYPKAFPKLFIALIRAGESSGAIDTMLKRLTRYLEDADRLRKILKSAMMYPIIVITIGVGVVAMMLVFVIPKFEELMKGNGQELPGPTQFVLDLSHFMVGNILYIIGGLVTAGVLIFKFVNTDEGRAILHRTLFRAPLFGPLMQKGGVARFARTMQTLLASGVNLIDAIDICRATIDNAVLEESVAKIRAEVEAGKTLGMVTSKMPVFPTLASQMISIGESTGNLDKMLEKLADFYEEEVETMVGGLTKLIEPILLVFLGGTVGGLMIAMYLPIFKMAGSG